MPPARERLLALAKVSCRIFSTTFNPNNIRTGNKILRQRLKGPTFLDYYPKRVATFKDLKRSFPMLQFRDVEEESRVRDVAAKKFRGKGAPKKIRTKEEAGAKKGKKR
ncbi:mitochondral 37S ribosomal protein S27 [Maublancomyces gigas]|uniref:Small ribosomal subunit protein mS33 n=1 Tax=Discina gigas TaxID=1032678 RepID=A0ABR3GET8_9PEZI